VSAVGILRAPGEMYLHNFAAQRDVAGVEEAYAAARRKRALRLSKKRATEAERIAYLLG
jgi:hypothetical protein